MEPQHPDEAQGEAARRQRGRVAAHAHVQRARPGWGRMAALKPREARVPVQEILEVVEDPRELGFC